MSNRMLSVSVVAVLAFLGQACAHAPCTTPPPYHVTVLAARNSNPGLNGTPLSTTVLLLQLKGIEKLKNADFNEIREHPAEVLGEELIGKPEEITLNPGEADTRWIARDAGARYVAAIAIFRQPTQQKWLAWQDLGRLDESRCKVPPPDAKLDRWPKREDTQIWFRLSGSELEPVDPPATSSSLAPLAPVVKVDA